MWLAALFLHIPSPAFGHLQKSISLLDGPLVCPGWSSPPVILQEIPPRGFRRSKTLQPLLLHPSALGQGERASSTAPAHLLSQPGLAALPGCKSSFPNASKHRFIQAHLNFCRNFHTLALLAAHPCVQLFRNGRIWILSTANYKNLTHLLVNFTNTLNESGFLLVNDLSFCCSGNAVPNNMDL